MVQFTTSALLLALAGGALGSAGGKESGFGLGFNANGRVQSTGQPHPSQAKPSEPVVRQGGEPSSQDETIEVTVDADPRRVQSVERSSSDVVIGREILAAAPRSEGAEILRSAPGLYLGRGEGGSVAHNYSLRGFDSEHGQDIQFRVGGLPINLPAHIHGQGYSDLGFLIGDVVHQLSIQPGVYDPAQGDFAVAGSIALSLGVSPRQRGLTLRSGYGRWNRFDQLLLWAPKKASIESFGAIKYSQSNGFGQNRAGKSVSAILQHRFVARDWSHRLLGVVYASRYGMAGVLRHDDVLAGRIKPTDVYPFPTARAQNAMNQRMMLGIFSSYTGENRQSGAIDAWVSVDTFRIQQNFTGFIEQSRVLNRVGGRGDLIEQRNHALSMGVSGRFSSQTYRPFRSVSAMFRVGVEARMDLIEQEQALLDAAVRSQTWDRRLDAEIRAVDAGAFAEFATRIASDFKFSAGLRADVLSYEVDDKLGNFAPNTRPKDQFIQGFRRSAQGLSLGPRTSLQYWPTSRFALKAAYGQGYRSPQARTLADGESAPFTKVHSADLGASLNLDPILNLSLSGYYTHLSDDVAFKASHGRLERTGASQRFGATFHAHSMFNRWLSAAVSATYVHASLLEPPPATAQEPLPIFQKGQHLPYVPPLVARVDLGARGTLLSSLGDSELRGGVGLGASFLSPRPLPYGAWADAVSLVDLSMDLSWKRFTLGVEFFNLLNSKFAAVEYSFASDWNPKDGVRPRVPIRHRSAGAPFSWFTTLGVQL